MNENENHYYQRSTLQVKTHAQVELKKIDSGIAIFAELDDSNDSNDGTNSSTNKDTQIPPDLIRIILGSPRPKNYKYKPSPQSQESKEGGGKHFCYYSNYCYCDYCYYYCSP